MIKGIEVNIFDGDGASGVTVLPSSTLCLPDINPVSSLIASTLKPLFFDKSLYKMNRMGIFVVPVSDNTFHNNTEDMACKVWYPDPWQNKKTDVIGHEVYISLTSAITPSYECISWGSFPCCRAKKQTGKITSISVSDKVFDVFSNTMVSEVMMGGQIPYKTAIFKRSRVRNYHAQRFQFRQFRTYMFRTGNKLRNFGNSTAMTPPKLYSNRRQRNKTPLLKLEQKTSTGKGLWMSSMSMPIPNATKLNSQTVNAPVAVFGNPASKPFQIRNGNLSALADNSIFHVKEYAIIGNA